MKMILLSTVALSLLICGCATHRLAVTVDTARIDVELPDSLTKLGLTPTQAANIFRNVASQLGLTVNGPKQYGQLYFSTMYTADAPRTTTSTDKPSLTMFIEDKQIEFTSSLYRDDTSENFTAAENAAALFEQELDKRHIKYKVTKMPGWLFGPGP